MPLKGAVVFQLVGPVFSMCLPPFTSVHFMAAEDTTQEDTSISLSVVLPYAWGLINLIIPDCPPFLLGCAINCQRLGLVQKIICI